MLIYCRAPLPPDSCLYDKYCGKKASDCGLFELERWNVHHHSCVDFIQPFRQQLLESETVFSGVCHKNCTSVVDFILHNEWVHLCLPLFVWSVTLLMLPNLVYKCKSLSFMEVQAKLNDLFPSTIISKIKLLLYIQTMWSLYYYHVCNFWQTFQIMLNYLLTIEMLIFNFNLGFQ